MLEAIGNKLFFGAKAKIFVFIANPNSTSHIIFDLSKFRNLFQRNDIITLSKSYINNFPI